MLRTALLVVACALFFGSIGFFIGRRAAPAAGFHASSDASPSHEPRQLPPIPSIEASTKRLDLTKKPPLSDVIAKINEAASRHSWRFNKEWEIIVNSLDSADFPPLMAALEKHPLSGARIPIAHALYSRWAEEDPAAALARAQIRFPRQVPQSRRLLQRLGRTRSRGRR